MGLRIDTREYRYHPDFGELLDFEKHAFVLDWCNAVDVKANWEYEAGGYSGNDEFTRRTTLFCYQDIGLPVYGIHRPYIARVLQLTAGLPNCTLIDVGAGGGQVGLAFHHLGYKVSFADIASQSLIFLLYRLHQRGLNLPVYNLDGQAPIPQHHIAICFDVLEHIDEPGRLDLLDRLPLWGDIVLTNLIRESPDKFGHNLVEEGIHYAVDMDKTRDYVLGRYSGISQDYYPDEKGVPRQRLLIYTSRGKVVK